MPRDTTAAQAVNKAKQDHRRKMAARLAKTLTRPDGSPDTAAIARALRVNVTTARHYLRSLGKLPTVDELRQNRLAFRDAERVEKFHRLIAAIPDDVTSVRGWLGDELGMCRKDFLKFRHRNNLRIDELVRERRRKRPTPKPAPAPPRPVPPPKSPQMANPERVPKDIAERLERLRELKQQYGPAIPAEVFAATFPTHRRSQA